MESTSPHRVHHTQLHDVLDDLLDDLLGADVHEWSDADVHELVGSLTRAQNRLDAALSSAVQAWDGRQVWADDGSKSARARLVREAGWSASRAGKVVARARQLRRMPCVSDALAAGEISADHVDLLHRAERHQSLDVPFAEAEPLLVDLCREQRYEFCRQVVDRWIAHADPDGDDERAEHRRGTRHLGAATTLDGLVHIRGLLDPVGGAAFIVELGRLERELYVEDQRTGTVRTPTQRRADALVEMAHRSRTCAGSDRRPRPLISFLVGVDSFARVCELANGQQLTPGELLPYLAEADIERIVFDGPDRVLSVSRRRAFTGAVRRAIEVRDQYCAHPCGCDDPADHGDIDHRLLHSQGGLTDERNGRALCRGHNRHHELRDRAPEPGAPRTGRPPRGYLPEGPAGSAPADGDDDDDDDDGDDDVEHPAA